MWSTTAPTTNTCTTKASSKRLLLAGLAALLLAGCVNDTASYLIDGKEHHIMLHRVQDWFWQDSLEVTIAPTRMPDCRGGLSVKDVPRNASVELYQAPPDYAEPIYILKVDQRLFAISTASCRVQEFKQAPAALGTRLGSFQEVEGKLQFQPAK